ncbi:MAG: AI-2E family transporter, partial [Bacteroidetes bacterium]|nr:AI-2E family transporter [Bacteroidota bacterium]
DKLKFPNTIAVIVTLFVLASLMIGLISMFIPLIMKQGENLSLLNIDTLRANIRSIFNELNLYFLGHNIDLLNEIKDAGFIKNLIVIPNLLNSVIQVLGNMSIALFSIIFITFFFMKDGMLVENSVSTMVNENSQKKVRKSFKKIKNLLSRYFIGLLIQITILFVIYTISLLLFGIENALVIAFLCALLNLIPYIGPLIGGFLMLFLTMSSNLGQDFRTVILPTTLFVMAGYVLAQLIDNFLSQPLIFSNRVKSHPLEIFLVIIISGTLFGIAGMIIAIPSYTCIKVVLQEFLSDNKIVKSLTKDF